MSRSTTFSARLIQLGFIAVFGAAWYWSTTTGSVSKLFLPEPAAVWLAFSRLVTTGQFWSAVKVTLTTIAQAYAIALVAGILAGYLVSRSRFLIDVLEPIIASLFTIPITLFFPMFILFFGIGTGSKIAYGATYAFFPIALNTIAGFGYVDKVLITAARSMGASDYQLFRYVLLPAALPVILTGMRMGFTVALLSIIGSETIASLAGLGHRIVHLAEAMEMARMFAYIAFVVAIAAILNALVSGLEARGRRRR